MHLLLLLTFVTLSLFTGVDLSKILGGQTKILGGTKGGKSDKCTGVSQLLGAAPLSLRLCLCSWALGTMPIVPISISAYAIMGVNETIY